MNVLKGAVHQMVPLVTSSLKEDCDDFHCFHAIDQLYQEGIKLKNFQNEENGILKGLPPMSRTIKKIEDSANQVSDVLQFAEPSILSSKINTYTFQNADHTNIMFPPKNHIICMYGEIMTTDGFNF